MGAVLALSLWMNRSDWKDGAPGKPRAFSQVGLVLFLFLTLANGFGVQYLAWLVPWVVELGALPTVALYAASGAFLFLVYDYWAQGFPWYLADSNRVGTYVGHFDMSMVLCWLTVAAVLWLAWRRMETDTNGTVAASALTRRKLPLAAGLLFGVVVLLPVARRLVFPPTFTREDAGEDALNAIRSGQYRELAAYLFGVGRQEEAQSALAESRRLASMTAASTRPSVVFPAASAAPTPESLLNLSLVEYRAGRFKESIEASRAALAVRPAWAEAHNNMAAAYASLRMWDEAIQESGEAVRLKPDFQLARNNLAWALEQKRIHGSSPK